MFSVMENNVGYVGGAAATAAAPYMTSRELYPHLPVMSYTQMLRMSLADGEGADDMASSIVGREAYDYVLQGTAMEMKDEEEGELEGYAESDYDLTCLRLGLSRPGSSAEAMASTVFVAEDQRTAPSCSIVAAAATASSRQSSGFTRTCTLCGTSKTPLWRSGPMGAKSLCNACGIRSKKAKKGAAAASAVVGDEVEERCGSLICSSRQKKQQVAPKKAAKRKMEVSELEGGAEADGKQQQQVKRRQQQQQQQQTAARSDVNGVNDNSSGDVEPAGSPVKTSESSSCVTAAYNSGGTPPWPTPTSSATPRRRPLPLSPSSRSPPLPQASDRPFSCHTHGADTAGHLFPKDEEQAAFLLMALSCGLVLAS